MDVHHVFPVSCGFDVGKISLVVRMSFMEVEVVESILDFVVLDPDTVSVVSHVVFTHVYLVPVVIVVGVFDPDDVFMVVILVHLFVVSNSGFSVSGSVMVDSAPSLVYVPFVIGDVHLLSPVDPPMMPVCSSLMEFDSKAHVVMVSMPVDALKSFVVVVSMPVMDGDSNVLLFLEVHDVFQVDVMFINSHFTVSQFVESDHVVSISVIEVDIVVGSSFVDYPSVVIDFDHSKGISVFSDPVSLLLFVLVHVMVEHNHEMIVMSPSLV